MLYSRKFIVFMLILACLLHGCRKWDTSRENMINELIHVDPNSPQIIKDIAKQIRLQESKEAFIEQLVKTEGRILWPQYEVVNDNGQQRAYIPLVLDETKYVNSYIYYSSQTNELKLVSGKTYESYGFDLSVPLNANTVVSDLIRLNTRYLGTRYLKCTMLDYLDFYRQERYFHPTY